MRRTYIITCLVCLTCLGAMLHAQTAVSTLAIVETSPGINANHVPVTNPIVITFDQDIEATTVNDANIIVRGSQSGKIGGVYTGGGTQIIVFDPANNFKPGEIISTTITTGLMDISGLPLNRGYTFSFTARTDPAPSTPAVFAHRNLSGATQGEGAATLDFDSDGDLDIITAHEGIPEQLIVYDNDGELSFCGMSTGGNFREVEMYDIDGDGDYDNFGQTGSFDTELNWFENEGTMPFTERLVSFEDPWMIAGGDIDSDGDIDVVAPVILPNRVLWWSNDGSGNFSGSMEINSSFEGGSDSHFLIRDINGDGAMDILAFHEDDYNLVWYENNGSQIFTEILIANRSDRAQVTSADIDDDGDVDIVASSTEFSPTTALAWFENDGSENFTEHPIPMTITVGPKAAIVVDVDGDMDMDIVAGGYLLENDGSENFTESPIGEGLRAGDNYYAQALSFGDVDDDGDVDLITLEWGEVSWQENTSILEVTDVSPANGNANTMPSANISITFDQSVDGATINENTVSVVSQNYGRISGSYSGGGSNTIIFEPDENFEYSDVIEVSISDKIRSTDGASLASAYGFSFSVESAGVDVAQFAIQTLHTHGSLATGLDIADIDGDGDLDIVTSSFTEMFWHRNDGSGNFEAIPITVSISPVGVFAFDQNGDGYMDIACDGSGNDGTNLYINDGNQNFTEVALIGISTMQQITDVNHDGAADLVWLSWNTNYVGVSISRCDLYPNFGTIPDISSKTVQAGDMDDDGDIDFVATGSLGIEYYENDSFFNYANTTIDAVSSTGQALSDLDDDGDLDVVVVESFSAITWYENRLSEVSEDFGPRQEIGVLNQDPRDVVAADLDGDGDADVAAVSRNDDKVVWYENRLNEASADFGPEQIGVTTADRPVQIAAGDMDGNGSMDLVTISDGDNELNWFRNTGVVSNIDIESTDLPATFALNQNYPNPFNPSTTISFDVPVTSEVRVRIYDVSGRLARELVRGVISAGNHQINWDGTDDAGMLVSSGVYFCRLSYRSLLADGIEGNHSRTSGVHDLPTRQMLLVR